MSTMFKFPNMSLDCSQSLSINSPQFCQTQIAKNRQIFEKYHRFCFLVESLTELRGRAILPLLSALANDDLFTEVT